jgi:hypothetical protein
MYLNSVSRTETDQIKQNTAINQIVQYLNSRIISPTDVTSASTVVVGDADRLFIIKLAAPGTVHFTLGSVNARQDRDLVVVDFAGNAAFDFTPNGAETIMTLTGSPAWSVGAGGAGMGRSIRLIPDVTQAGWAVAA